MFIIFITILKNKGNKNWTKDKIEPQSLAQLPLYLL